MTTPRWCPECGENLTEFPARVCEGCNETYCLRCIHPEAHGCPSLPDDERRD